MPVKFATITTNLLDLWAEPKYNSERRSQLLFGETVSLRKGRNGFLNVREADGYSGWVDERFVSASRPGPSPPPKGWRWAVVSDPTSRLHTAAGQVLVPPYYMYYGTRLLVRPFRRGVLRVRFPDGSVHQVSTRSVRIVRKS